MTTHARASGAEGRAVLIVSLGSTAGLRAADEELRASLERAGASVTVVRALRPHPVRTLMLTDLTWARAPRAAAAPRLAPALPGARAGRGAAASALASPGRPRAASVIYSSTTAALLWPVPGAIRF